MSDGDDPVIGGREPPPDHESFEGARAAGFPALRRSLESRRRAMSAPVGAAGGEPMLEQAARRLVERLDFIHEHSAYKAVWTLAHVHGGYDGPNYAEELAALRAALRSAPPRDDAEAARG
jgi:hypothetical protein